MDPAQLVVAYARKKGWHADFSFKERSLRITAPELRRPQIALPQSLGQGEFFTIDFFGYSPLERLQHAFWDCLGETRYRPSSCVFLSTHCSKVKPYENRDNKLAQRLHTFSKEENKDMRMFPFELFDRWDIMVHASDGMDEGEYEPKYHARLERHGLEVVTTGLYDCFETERPNGWGDATVDTLLVTPTATERRSYLRNQIDISKYTAEGFIEVETKKEETSKVMFRLLRCFADRVKALKKGVYDHIHDEPFDFGDAADAAIHLEEAATCKTSHLRFLPKLKN